jgi:hypothetical protein
MEVGHATLSADTGRALRSTAEAVGLDPWAAFCATSYGKFQILGENFGRCGFETPWAFAASQAYDEVSQLKSFEQFIQRSGIIRPLRS